MSHDHVIEAIKKAIGSHGLWKGRLRDAIDTKTSEFEVSFVRSCHNCEFGKWLDGDKANLEKYEYYAQVYEMHKAVHLVTAEVMELALSGKKEEAETILENKFADQSSKLILKMMEWQKSLKSAA